ncbi:DUF3037 domain-containing protein [Nocardioides sp. zg-DK7169]|uniref:DUF3037 domain-containing protein n=1 Tax=Nocardioides sp. zg-DK7169 TaxID=2736600 RepID=UPI00155579C3|nr:DUF3037 domain-containing protein [Nocardioides sp. zg-DK7169]NPC96790.1 DUF3037 domain-containing protein [Nocardioides sp. zg-DK7169]
MSTRLPYQYVVLRCVPRVDREEFLNVGVVLYCQAADYLAARWDADPERLGALFAGLDVQQVCDALAFAEGVCAGDERGGAASAHPIGQRFGFLRAPKSTVIQPGPVHGGLTEDPAAELVRLVAHLVG